MFNLNDTSLLHSKSQYHPDGRPKTKDAQNLQDWRRNTGRPVSPSFMNWIRALTILAGRALGSRSRRGPTLTPDQTKPISQDATAPCRTALDKAA